MTDRSIQLVAKGVGTSYGVPVATVLGLITTDDLPSVTAQGGATAAAVAALPVVASLTVAEANVEGSYTGTITLPEGALLTRVSYVGAQWANTAALTVNDGSADLVDAAALGDGAVAESVAVNGHYAAGATLSATIVQTGTDPGTGGLVIAAEYVIQTPAAMTAPEAE